jgi:hypothetical protein
LMARQKELDDAGEPAVEAPVHCWR